MSNLKVEYAGLKLKNPFIASSSGLTKSFEKIKELYSKGIGAVVLKSIFEEQINEEINHNFSDNYYPEAYDYIKNYIKSQSLKDYLDLIEKCKKNFDIPIIASINCISKGEWINFIKQIENSGTDAIELNIFYLPVDDEKNGLYYENIYFEIIEKIKAITKLPIIVKIGINFSNPVYFIKNLSYRGISAVVLFNRFYNPDINLNNLSFTSGEILTQPTDFYNSLRWVAIISSKNIPIDISASTGIHNYESALKMFLAGSKTVQLCSTIYKNGLNIIPETLKNVEDWLEKNGYKSINEIIGKMNYGNIQDSSIYERVQFMKYFSSRDDI